MCVCRQLASVARLPLRGPASSRSCLAFFALISLALFLLTYYFLYTGGYVKEEARLRLTGESNETTGRGDGKGTVSKIKTGKAEKDKDEKTEFGDREMSKSKWKVKTRVKNVIGLLSKTNQSGAGTFMNSIDPNLLQSQIRLLVEAMMSDRTMLDKPAKAPHCMGNTRPTEVEDLFCIPKPAYLPDVKNPCWLERGVDGLHSKMRCLPYFHILGVAKAGTTDLWNRLMGHPHIVSNDGLLHKEALWWSWRRYGLAGYRKMRPWTFTEYTGLFQDTARQVEISLQQRKEYHRILITGDGSPPDFWDFRGWRNISQNRGLVQPQVITPHLMKHLYRTPKFIFLFKDPVDRLYSDYFFVSGGLTTLDFHNDVMATINMLSSCVRLLGLKQCFFDHKLYAKLPVRLPFACYSVYLREWLRVFPLESFLFLKTEEYAKNTKNTLKQVLKFLELAPLDKATLSEIAKEERSRITVQKQEAGAMMEETRAVLVQLLGPCNARLRAQVKDDRFTWEDS